MRGMRSALLGATAATIFFAASSAAQAATIPVTSLTDDGAGCTLREAVASADANSDQGGCVGTSLPGPTVYGDDVIRFATGDQPGEIDLASELVIDPAQPGTLRIDSTDGPGITLSGGDSHRVLRITAAADSTANAVTIVGPTIRDGFINGFTNPFPAGAGIFNAGNLTLASVRIADNRGEVTGDLNASVNGAGIYSDGTLVLTDSTVTGNSLLGSAVSTAGVQGGGVSLSGGTIRRSTINQNSVVAVVSASDALVSRGRAGGIATGGDTLIQSSTIVDNAASSTGGSTNVEGGGGLDVNGGVATIVGSTITGNQAATGANLYREFGYEANVTSTVFAEPVEGQNCDGTFTSNGYNLADDGSCSIGVGGDRFDVDANLQPLADNGGPTLTRRPAPPAAGVPSPLIDGGVAFRQPADQRGRPRIVDFNLANPPGGDGTDIGAVEIQGSATPETTTPASPNTDTSPEVAGTAVPEFGTSPDVVLYRDANCATEVGRGTSALFESTGISAALATGTANALRGRTSYGTALSPCSAAGVAYEIPTPTPMLTGTTPAAGANDNNPRVRGSALAGSTVRLFTNSTCTGPAAATGTAAEFSDSGIAVPVPDNSTTEIRAVAVSADGVESSCSEPTAYTEVTPAAVPPPDVTPVPSPQPPKKPKCKKKKGKKAGTSAKRCKKPRKKR